MSECLPAYALIPKESEPVHDGAGISPLVRFPNPALRRPVRSVALAAIGTHALTTQAAAMLQICEQERGIGLAAQQVGLDLSLAVVPLYGGNDKPALCVVANLEVVERGPEEFAEEGCLSLYSVMAQVLAPTWVRVRGIDAISGRDVDEIIRGYAARAMCHEADHLVGKLLIDRVKPPWRKIFTRQVDKARARVLLNTVSRTAKR